MDRPEPASAPAQQAQATDQDSFRVQAPAVSLPKGGGAIKGIGEKFAANPVTGTGSMSIPIATSPGRGGFGPQLSLSYVSGAGNGPFGFGWSLSLPSITRKTDKGLPRYRDHEESDVFILSGAEDLVPELFGDGSRQKNDSADGLFTIHRYRPRIEGLFARIERWTRKSDGDVRWRSISKDNIITWYGENDESRITDPGNKSRIFSWLICQSCDDKGNAMVYTYAKENGADVELSNSHERNRGTRDSATRTAQRYLKRIRYGNRISTLKDRVGRTAPLADVWISAANWMFTTLFDYGEGHYPVELTENGRVYTDPSFNAPEDGWPARQDPFSNHRSGFEVRTCRLCRRVLMFHHFTDELGTPDYLVRSTSFSYKEDTVASFITSVEQGGYVRQSDGRYLKRSMPPVEFTYSQVEIDTTVQTLDAQSMENLPIGIDGAYQFVDLDGEGSSGMLTEQGDAWYYKPPMGDGKLGGMTVVVKKPNMALAGGAQLLDLAGDGQLDLANFRGPVTGFYERTQDADWETLRAFRQVPNIAWDDPNLRFVDVNGDGHADVLITEHQAITWYPSIAEEGFDPAERVTTPFDEEQGPALVFADGTQSIYLADMCGDGLTDLVRIRNGEVCYWPNLGYGRFGAKVTMDDSPWFDHPDQFDQKRVRIADIDGSGNIDILYLAADRVRVFLNQSGNRFVEAPSIAHAFPYDNLKNVATADVLGKGTACLVWTSSLPGDARAPMKFIDLMKQGKPHLLIKSENNLGAETVVQYAPSTKFYFDDKRAGKHWITRLAFPVHVVERVETYDRISRNRFVTRYAYHHGYFDGGEREFRGFGMVEQWDTEEYAALSGSDAFPVGDNVDQQSHVPPMHTKTWFHTGAFLDEQRIARLYAKEYFRESGMSDAQFTAQLLDDTTLPEGLTTEEAHQAVRALKGSVLRQEVYTDDGTDKALLPYSVSERNYTIKLLQPRGQNKHAVFFAHANETIDLHYERNPVDPRIAHALTLEVDGYGNVLKSAAIAYPRREPDPSLAERDQAQQTRLYATFSENAVTNACEQQDAWRTPLPAAATTWELAGLSLAPGQFRFGSEDVSIAFDGAPTLPYEEDATYATPQKRVIEALRVIYRADDLSSPLPFGEVEPLAIPYESYKRALTPGLLDALYVRPGKATMAQLTTILAAEGRYVQADGSADWWISSGRVFFAREVEDEVAAARTGFFLPARVVDPFGASTHVRYDAHRLLPMDTEDAIGNRMTVGERDATGAITTNGNDYRVLQPRLVMDANRNRAEVAFDTLGLVVGTAVMGKPEEQLGDSLEGFVADLTEAQVLAYFEAPFAGARELLQGATTRLVYDAFAYQRTKAEAVPSPVPSGSIVRETHRSEENGTPTKLQVGFSYSDGFGREVQRKVQAEPGPLVRGGPALDSRWVGTGWTIFNNKGKPVRQYEPFFSATHRFEFGVQVGVSPVLFYDPTERVVATLNPDHTWSKVVFDPWKQTTWDASDLLFADPASDADVGAYFRKLPASEYLPRWHALRTDAAHAAEFAQHYPDAEDRANETTAARQSEVHAQTPTTAHADSLGRTFLNVAMNRAQLTASSPITEEVAETRVELDIEGNQRSVTDALGRVVMRYRQDMLGTRLHQHSMEAGARWMLNDAAGQPLRAWNDRGFVTRITYDAVRRPLATYVLGADTELPNAEVLVDRLSYGDSAETGLTTAEREALNLRGQVHRHFDPAGLVNSEGYDFKGQLLSGTRRFAREYKRAPDWSSVHEGLHNAPATLSSVAQDLLEPETFRSSTRTDALGRPIALTTPDNSVLRPRYNEANLLDGITGQVRSAVAETVIVHNIDYDAKGQRVAIVYGNGVRTGYRYDPLTFRLRQLRSQRYPQRPEEQASTGWPGNGLQDLHYTYDPAGNITHIRDTAQQTLFFRNKRVEPSTRYTYDALYRLIEAQGREHLGQAGTPVPLTHNDRQRTTHVAPSDGHAMGLYTQRYTYDLVGNILALAHRGMDPAASGWTRTYFYEETSLLEPGRVSNRLSRTRLGDTNEPYTHDAHGSMTSMPHLPMMLWDYRDQLACSQRQQVGADDTDGAAQQGERTYYVYDASGQRVRKVTERSGTTPTRLKERLYLGGWEIYREYANDGSTITLERETLHAMDDKQRICLVETKTREDETTLPAPQPLLRYQLSNHLGSAALEVDANAQVISYEEFYPYGNTSYHLHIGGAEVSAKRYRYTGMERDEESGLGYHGTRLYSFWLGKWESADRLGLIDGPNLYKYVRSNPILFSDTDGQESKQQKWTADFEARYARFKNIGGGGDPEKGAIEGVMTVTGIRVPGKPGATLLPRPFYERRAAAFAAWQGFIHYAELIEAGHDAAATQIALRELEVRGREMPLDADLDLAAYTGWSKRAVATRMNLEGAMLIAETGLVLAPMFKALRTYRASQTRRAVTQTSAAPLESAGASTRGREFQSASAATQRSVVTSVRADVAEAEAYKAALGQGEIGLQRPQGSSVAGVDFITARKDSGGLMEVIVTDVKASMVGKFPTPATSVKATWMDEVNAAVAPGRLDLGDAALESEIRSAVTAKRVRMRQVNVDYSPTPQGQGTMSGL